MDSSVGQAPIDVQPSQKEIENSVDKLDKTRDNGLHHTTLELTYEHTTHSSATPPIQ